MGASWEFTGIDVGRLIATVEGNFRATVDEAAGEMATLGEKLRLRMIQVLYAAVTPTGLRRDPGGGPRAGRFDTGEMHQAIDYAVNVDGSGHEYDITLTWGWPDEVWRDYFGIQDLGLGGVPAAGSLADSFTLAIAETARILNEMSRR